MFFLKNCKLDIVQKPENWMLYKKPEYWMINKKNWKQDVVEKKLKTRCCPRKPGNWMLSKKVKNWLLSKKS